MIPDVIDLSDLIDNSEGISKIVMESVQSMLLKLALQMARDDYLVRRQRQAQGIAIAKEQHKYLGRRANKTKN